MKNRPSQEARRSRLAPLDHLKPRSRSRAEPEAAERDVPPADIRRGPGSAEPAEPISPGAGDAEAVRGKATRSPDAVATRPHLEGSEQGPQ